MPKYRNHILEEYGFCPKTKFRMKVELRKEMIKPRVTGSKEFPSRLNTWQDKAKQSLGEQVILQIHHNAPSPTARTTFHTPRSIHTRKCSGP